MKKLNFKHLLTCCVFAAGTAIHMCAENTITWETLGNATQADGGNFYVQRFTVNADGPFNRLAFCAFKRAMKPVNPSDTVMEILPGYYAVSSPRFVEADKGVPVVVDIITDGALRNISFRPDGMHLIADGQAVPAENVFKPMTSFPEQYQVLNSDRVYDGMIYGPAAYEINDSLRTSFRPSPYSGIPTPKSVKLTGKKCRRPAPESVRIIPVENDRHDYFRAEISNGYVNVYTNSTDPSTIVASVMRRINAAVDAEDYVPEAVIEDWADLAYRGLMIDIARNFTTPGDLKKIVDLMATYGLNVLHLHAGDDEGWRIEIPELPELTLVGSRRGYTLDDNVPYLKQIYSGDGSPDSKNTPANGYYTVDEFIDILQYAYKKGVAVIPEFDTPGHSRAAIRAMEYRYKQTGDDSLRLIHDGDTSDYTTAQDFHDNLMNPALEGPYRFWDIVIGSIVSTYSRAGVPLQAIHIGGDEVPAHAWDGSDVAQTLMAEKDMADQRELFAYFVERVAGIAKKHGIDIAGWQEVALGHSPEYDASVKPVVAAINCWTSSGDNGVTIASKGYPLILSNVDYLYFDQTYSSHPEEPGLTWGGIVDEFKPLHATVDKLCPAESETQSRVKGISAHLFAETIRSRAMIEQYILPRLLGLAERAHNATPTLTDEEYFGNLTSEMAGWAVNGINFHLRQPGIRIVGDTVEMNDAYGAGEIRYTLDGSEPHSNSTLYTAPFKAGDSRQIRARLFYGPAESVTSILYLD